jgi:SAM-dependent methyltransferase
MIEDLVRRTGADNAVLGDRDGGAAAHGVLYVIDRRDSAHTPAERRRTSGTVDLWAKIFDQEYAGGPADPTFDTSSWRSKISSRAFSPEEMRDWVGCALARIRALGGRRIYEIGCGTGLLLWPLIEHCDHYRGTDISSVAVKRLQGELERRGAGHARVARAEGADFGDLRAGEVDTVVINSVTQYFPSEDYLRRVLDNSLDVLPPGGHVFVGDVRNFDLLDALHMSVVLSRDQETLSGPRRRQSLKCSVAAEPELLLSPQWFVRYAAEHGLKIGVMPKIGRFDNELDRFRYDVVLRVPEEPGGECRPEYELSDWPRDGTGPERIRAAIADGQRIGFRAVPHPSVGGLSVAAHATIYGQAERFPAVDRSREPLVIPPALRPGNIAQAAAQAGRSVVLSLAGGHPHGAFDLIIGADSAFEAPTGAGVRSAVCTVPWVSGEHGGYVAADILRVARSLPLSERPVAVVGVSDLGGPLPLPTALDGVDAYVAPRSVAERALAGAWQAALAIEQVGIHDAFPLLGGTRLGAGQVVETAAGHGLTVTADDLLSGRSIADLLQEG